MDHSELIIGQSSEHIYKDITYPHAHLRAQLLYASIGTIQVYTPQQMWIVPPKCALWIPARIEHSVIALSYVKMNTALIEEKAARVMSQHCFIIRVGNLLHELLIRLNETHHLPISSGINSDELFRALQVLIFEEIHKANLLPIQIPWPKDARLLKICQALFDTPNDLKDLNAWADEISTSPRTLMRMFQKDTGLSYRSWIQQLHIALALSKIGHGEAISSIATSLGYTNASAFSAMFKRHLGKTPQQFKG
ncbi:helix-turn-helix transcriptional regulator [Acinetobacter sp. MD2(2019)]|nr:helix-turn-helix transcriptional regulator [Acinetobacter sp. MD2(2019)]MEB3754029.1 helix-turn-helix transcriptional regulator [Acinetobacter sp. MD2(2019)]